MIIRKVTSDDSENIALVHTNSWRITYDGIIIEDYLNTSNTSLEIKTNQWIEKIKDVNSMILVLDMKRSRPPHIHN